MAEIKIEKKKPIWPWILIILIILAAIYFFWYYNDNNYNTDDQVIVNDTITQIDDTNNYDNEVVNSTALYTGSYGTVRNEQSIADYLNFVDDNKEMDQATTSEHYRSGFFKLISATKRESEIKNIDVSDHIAAAMKNAEDLTNNPTTNQKADKIKLTAESVGKALKKIQQESFTNLLSEANAVVTASNNINSNGTLEEDKDNIDTFFDKSAILLQKMDENNDQKY